MKALTIVAIILGVAFIFFVAKAERSLVITAGDEVVPAGLINVPKALLDKVGEMGFKISNSGEIGNLVNLEPISTDNIVAGTKEFISSTIDKIKETIKAPIEDKINDFLCPQK
ncbi:hypothetical protein KKH14_01655 [Patescibacteria group bacterium]|nr:hypothetical protein [Patescibacteria group bacterium]